jgi:hypothetical protein
VQLLPPSKPKNQEPARAAVEEEPVAEGGAVEGEAVAESEAANGRSRGDGVPGKDSQQKRRKEDGKEKPPDVSAPTP